MQMKFRCAEHYELPTLQALWKECFSDTDENTELIFERLIKPENILVLADDKAPRAMLVIQEMQISTPFDIAKSAYIFGVATSPKFQGKGYSTQLLKSTDLLLKQRKFASSVLVPATAQLFEFYKKRGYTTAFNINKMTIKAKYINEVRDKMPVNFKKVSPDSMTLIRNSRFSDSKMYVCWPREYMQYIYEDCIINGGEVFTFNHREKDGCCVCYNDGDTVIVKEIAAAKASVDAVMYAIHQHFGASKYIFYLREDIQTSYTNNLLPFGMIKWYDSVIKDTFQKCEGKAPYITHCMD